MKQFQFVKNKYGHELLMDIGSYYHIPNYFFEPILHHTDFYEINISPREKLEFKNPKHVFYIFLEKKVALGS